jgi:hypothetical protein
MCILSWKGLVQQGQAAFSHGDGTRTIPRPQQGGHEVRVIPEEIWGADEGLEEGLGLPPGGGDGTGTNPRIVGPPGQLSHQERHRPGIAPRQGQGTVEAEGGVLVEGLTEHSNQAVSGCT